MENISFSDVYIMILFLSLPNILPFSLFMLDAQ